MECIQCGNNQLLQKNNQKLSDSQKDTQSRIKHALKKNPKLVQSILEESGLQIDDQNFKTYQYEIDMKCTNFELCGQYTRFKFCSFDCSACDKIFTCNKKDWELKNFIQQLLKQPTPYFQSYYSLEGVVKEFKIIENQLFLFQNEDQRIRVKSTSMNDQFYTLAADLNLADQKFYWEVIVENGNIKIGVTEVYQEDQCFSDFKTGYAFYTLGQLRHNNNSMGVKYGMKCNTGTIIGVVFHRNKLAFFINRNYFGIAFNNLNNQYLMPAIAIQKNAQIVIRYGMGIPLTYRE